MSNPKKRTTRLFVEQDLSGDLLTLDARQTHHLSHVLRLRRGDELIAFNGRGAERSAKIDALHRRGSTLSLLAQSAPLPESPLTLTLLQAMTKAEAMDLIVQKATELGVDRIVPVYTEFSVVKLDDDRTQRRIEHWRRIAESACEQCGRHRPLGLAPPAMLSTALADLRNEQSRLAFDPATNLPVTSVQAPPDWAVAVAIGPEGGFSGSDWRLLDAAGFQRISLGHRVLRAETAALAACAVLQCLWGDLGPTR